MKTSTPGAPEGRRTTWLTLGVVLVVATWFGCQRRTISGPTETEGGRALARNGGGAPPSGAGSCDAALAPRAPGAYTCGPNCARLRERPDRVVGVVVRLAARAPERAAAAGGSSGPDDIRGRRACLVAHLRKAGVEVVDGEVGAADLDRVRAVGPWARLAPALEVSATGAVEVDCSDPRTCRECASHDPASCELDPLCRAWGGARLDTARRCAGPPAPLACIPFDKPCEEGTLVARGPDRACWRLAGDCGVIGKLAGWTVAPGCDDGIPDPAPRCPGRRDTSRR